MTKEEPTASPKPIPNDLRIENVKPEEMRPILAGLLESAQASFPKGFVLSHARACPHCYHEGRLNLCVFGEQRGRKVALHVDPTCEAFKTMTCDEFAKSVDEELNGMLAN